MPILFVDLETTSVREPWLPGGRQIWQLAAIRREDDGSETAYNRFIRLDELDLSVSISRRMQSMTRSRTPTSSAICTTLCGPS